MCTSPGFCATDMTTEIRTVRPNLYSCYSGAFRIYQIAMNKEATSDVFYQRMRKSDYDNCGEELPFDDAYLEEDDC